jgi:hypothetical protein
VSAAAAAAARVRVSADACACCSRAADGTADVAFAGRRAVYHHWCAAPPTMRELGSMALPPVC